MREYKFRAWDNEANLMIYSDHRNRKLYDAYYYFETDSKGELKCNWETEWTESCPPDGGAFNNLMQYTGLKDSNGTEIYEGDIVIGTRLDNEVRGQIVWIDKIASFGIRYKHRNEDDPTAWCESSILKQLHITTEHFEFEARIIGNIYENAEMVKEK